MTQSTPTQPVAGANGPDGQIAAYIAQVRASLSDLRPDDLDDLTAGMPADLAEMLRERGGALTDHLGSPAAYADELRTAAGLPPRSGPRRRDWRYLPEELRERWQRARSRHPVLDAVASHLALLRPAWWLLRGLAATFLLLEAVGGGWRRLGEVPGALVALTAMGLSVWLGARMSVTRPRWWGALLNGFLGLISLVCLGSIAQVVALSQWSAGPVGYEQPATNLVQASNLFVYDAQGRRVDGARVFNDLGQSLQTNVPLTDASGRFLDEVVRTDAFGQTVDQVFPKRVPGLDPWARHANELAGWIWTPPQAFPPLAPLSPDDLPKPATPSTPPPAGTPPGTTTPAATLPTPTGPASGSATASPTPGAKPTTPAAVPPKAR